MKTYRLAPLVALLCLVAATAFLTPRVIANDVRTTAMAVNASTNRTVTGLVWMVGKNRGEYLTGPEIEKVLEITPHTAEEQA
jgi:hypothetical protein